MKHFYYILFLILVNQAVFSQNNFYWVGGDGNWSDLNHWQLENGTTPSSLPHEINPVIFNENSFVTENDFVNIDVLNAYCKDMIWENIPFNVWLSGGDSSLLFIYGSLKFHENVINDFNGRVMFDAYEIGNSTIELNGVTFNNAIFFSGIIGEWNLMDDLWMNNAALNLNTGKIYLEHGILNTNGHEIRCSSFHSDYFNSRTLNIQNSLIRLYVEEEDAWLINAENFELQAENSIIILEGDQVSYQNKNGGELELGSVYVKGAASSLINTDNLVIYQTIHLDGMYCTIGENFIADSVIVNGDNCSVEGEAEIANLVVNANQFTLPEGQYIKRLISYDPFSLSGSNYIEYGKFLNDTYFMGNNTFDTLILMPCYEFSGSWLYFQSGTTQTVNDSIYLRGNQCCNITLSSINPTELAYLRKDYGDADVSCDFLNIMGVGALSETLNFYAGANSTPLPDPNNPPPGWIFENDTNYYYGFQGATFEGCWGDPVILNASSFNGNDETQYYWNGSSIPGEITFEVTEPDTVTILIVYAEECYITDYAIVEFDSCESSININALNKLVTISPNPSNGVFTLNVESLYGDIDFVLFTIEGEMVFNEKISSVGFTTSRRYDFSHLNNGVYYALIMNKGKVAPKKIIFQ